MFGSAGSNVSVWTIVPGGPASGLTRSAADAWLLLVNVSDVVVETLARFVIVVGVATAGAKAPIVTVTRAPAARVPSAAVTVPLLAMHVPAVAAHVTAVSPVGSVSLMVTFAAGPVP